MRLMACELLYSSLSSLFFCVFFVFPIRQLEHLKALTALYQTQQDKILVTESTLCPVCEKPISAEMAFQVFPEKNRAFSTQKVIVHVSCAEGSKFVNSLPHSSSCCSSSSSSSSSTMSTGNKDGIEEGVSRVFSS